MRHDIEQSPQDLWSRTLEIRPKFGLGAPLYVTDWRQGQDDCPIGESGRPITSSMPLRSMGRAASNSTSASSLSSLESL
jgi:hypothetical protein